MSISPTKYCPGRAGLWAALALSLLSPFSLLANTQAETAGICDRVAGLAAQQTGVPISVLKAISLTETGRKRGNAFRSWPWTVNMEGKGIWFDSRAEAKSYVDKEFARGARSFDVGCFQINYKWHGQAFSSIDEMFDPVANALYAARFLQRLRGELGSWGKAAGAYHSRTKEYADRYQARFERIRAPLVHQDGSDIPDIPDIVLAAYGGEQAGVPLAPRINRYPLLQTGAVAGLGSLVPLDRRSTNPLIGPAPPVSAIE